MKLLLSVVFTHLARYDRRADADVMTTTCYCTLERAKGAGNKETKELKKG
jgi:hypothetical protein